MSFGLLTIKLFIAFFLPFLSRLITRCVYFYHLFMNMLMSFLLLLLHSLSYFLFLSFSSLSLSLSLDHHMIITSIPGILHHHFLSLSRPQHDQQLELFFLFLFLPVTHPSFLQQSRKSRRQNEKSSLFSKLGPVVLLRIANTVFIKDVIGIKIN